MRSDGVQTATMNLSTDGTLVGLGSMYKVIDGGVKGGQLISMRYNNAEVTTQTIVRTWLKLQTGFYTLLWQVTIEPNTLQVYTLTDPIQNFVLDANQELYVTVSQSQKVHVAASMT